MQFGLGVLELDKIQILHPRAVALVVDRVVDDVLRVVKRRDHFEITHLLNVARPIHKLWLDHELFLLHSIEHTTPLGSVQDIVEVAVQFLPQLIRYDDGSGIWIAAPFHDETFKIRSLHAVVVRCLNAERCRILECVCDLRSKI